MLEKVDVILEATPRAPFAAVVIAAIAVSWIEPASLVVGAAAISDGIGCVPDGAGAGAATPVAGVSLSFCAPFWLGYAGFSAVPFGVLVASGALTAASSASGPSSA